MLGISKFGLPHVINGRRHCSVTENLVSEEDMYLEIFNERMPITRCGQNVVLFITPD
jgi:hypothetical protein